jgi:hypothetical protein
MSYKTNMRFGVGWTDPRGTYAVIAPQRDGEPIEQGPFGLYHIVFFKPSDAIVSPAHLSFGKGGARDEVRVFNVFDAASATLAQAYQHKNSDRASAAEWLMNMVSVRYGVDTKKVVLL